MAKSFAAAAQYGASHRRQATGPPARHRAVRVAGGTAGQARHRGASDAVGREVPELQFLQCVLLLYTVYNELAIVSFLLLRYPCTN